MVDNVWISGFNMETIRISTKSSSVRCTSNHNVYVDGRGFIRADAVRYGDMVAVSDGGDEWSKYLNKLQKHLEDTRTPA